MKPNNVLIAPCMESGLCILSCDGLCSETTAIVGTMCRHIGGEAIGPPRRRQDDFMCLSGQASVEIIPALDEMVKSSFNSHTLKNHSADIRQVRLPET
jgi:hypothetical protein